MASYRLIEIETDDAYYPHEFSFREHTFTSLEAAQIYCARAYWNFFQEIFPEDRTMSCPGKFVLTDGKCRRDRAPDNLPVFPFPNTWEDLEAFLREQKFTYADVLAMFHHECTDPETMNPFIFKLQKICEMPLF